MKTTVSTLILTALLTTQVHSVNNLYAAQSLDVLGTISPCVRYLNASGSVGCGSGAVSGVAVRIENDNDIKLWQDRARSVGDFIVVTKSSSLAGILDFVNQTPQIRGVVMKLDSAGPYSEQSTVPNIQFSAPGTVSFPWNPNGLGLLSGELHCNVPLLAYNYSSDVVLSRAIEDAVNINALSNTYPMYAIEMDSQMYATKDSETCLRRSALSSKAFCTPVGGQSIYSSSSSVQAISKTTAGTKDVIWVTAQMDSQSAFPTMSVGADAYSSGVITLLSIADMMTRAPVPVTNLSHHIVYTLFNAEAWGYSGSRRLLRDVIKYSGCNQIDSQNPSKCLDPPMDDMSYQYLRPDRIDHLIEIGQLVPYNMSSNLTVYAHSMKPMTASILLNQLQTNAAGSVKVLQASSTDGLLPPSSTHTFFKYASSISQVVLTSHQHEFVNTHYASPLDTLSSTFFNDSSMQNMCDTATTIGQSVYKLAGGSILNSLTYTANCTLIRELWQCLGVNAACPLISRFQQEAPIEPLSHAADSFQTGLLSRYSAFLYKFMGNATTTQPPVNVDSAPASGPGKLCSALSDCDTTNNEICTANRCVVSFTRGYDAYGTGLAYSSSLNRYYVSDPSEPTWTVSIWGQGPSLIRVYQIDDVGAQAGQMVASILFTAITVGLMYVYGRPAFIKRFPMLGSVQL